MIDTDSIGGVLLVDDESEFVDTLQERLMTRGIDAQVAYDGEEALGLVAKSPFKVVVLDLKMPGLNGLQVLEKLRANHPTLEVIMLTGHGSVHERQSAEKIGIFAYLPKPQNIEVLVSFIRKASQKSSSASKRESIETFSCEKSEIEKTPLAKPPDR